MKRVVVSVLFTALAAVAASAQQAAQSGAMAPAAPASVVLNVGDQAPEFSLPGTDGKTYTLSALKGRHVVLAWYPKAMTQGCTLECRSIRDNSEALKKFNVAYFMASVDTQDDNKKFADQEQVNFPMLSDTDKKVAIAYGVVPSTGAGFAKRFTFYIGPDGRIQFIDKNVNPNVKTAGTDLAAKLTELGVKQK
jgi:thioredoxin-dependent peroxiredoxin